MDFKTFADAFSHNKRSKEHLINLLLTRVDRTPEFCLFLGAGASAGSGVKPAAKMISDWRRNLYASHKGKEPFKEWLNEQEWFGADDEYSRLFEMVYDQPSQRRTYIESATRTAKPGWGYAYLTALLKNNIFNVIFTTNFDDLINESCYRFTNDLRPMVCAHDSGVSSVRLMSDRPKVIKLHGDFLYDSIKNTSSELESLEANMRAKFIEFAKEYGLVVIGYSGNDQSIMDLLDVLVRSESYFRNGIYWCIRRSTSPSRRLRQLLRNDRIFWVEIDGYDEFMAEIAGAMHVSLPDGVTSPQTTSIERSSHLLECSKSSSSPILNRACDDLAEIYSRLREALSKIGLLRGLVGDNNAITRFKEETLPLVQSSYFIQTKQYADAIPLLEEVLESRDPNTSETAWMLLIGCYLINKSTLSDAENLLNSMPPEQWIHSKHFLMRAYYTLYLNKAEEALGFANRALELNPGSSSAKVNKALALFMSGRRDEAKSILDFLKSVKSEEHYRAAAHLLDGELNKCIALLQKAFVLGRYTPESACQDVAFRIAWGLPQFREALKPFAQSNVIDFPYQESCPMSEAEASLYKKLKKSVGKA